MGFTKYLVQPAQVAAAATKFSTLSVSRRAAALAVGLAAWGPVQAAQPTEWVKGRVIVQTRAGLSDAELGKIVKVHGGKASRIGKSDLHIIDLPGNMSETAVQAQLARNPHLKFAELDGLVRPNLTTNDPYLGSEWHLAKIGATIAWDSATGTGVTIAILDTGVDVSHPDLADKIVPGWNFHNNTSNIADDYGHGTKVAGTAAASTNNGIGVAGVAAATRIMPIRISDSAGTGSWSAMAQGLTYAADKGVRVANISFMVGGISTVQSAAQYMKSKGGLVFVSAGNTGVAYSAAPSSSLIVVGATAFDDTVASFSTFGPYVSLSAPGVGIYTTAKGAAYGAVNGTSFASPIAAGVAALVMAANPGLSSTQVESLLFSTALDLGSAGKDAYYGNGRIDAAAAVKAALALPVADTRSPTVSITSPGNSSTVSGLVVVDVMAADNVGVSRVELRANGSLVAADYSAPYGFSWDSSTSTNGMNNLTALAYDAAGNLATSTVVSVNVANNVVADTTPPAVTINNPVNGSVVASGTLLIATNATDNLGAASLLQTLLIDGRQVASATGGKLSYNWNTRKLAAGSHTISVTASDAAGNRSISSVSVTR